MVKCLLSDNPWMRETHMLLFKLFCNPHFVCLDLLHRTLSRTLKITGSPDHCMMFLTCLRPENSLERN